MDVWPLDFLTPQEEAWDLDGVVVSGGAALDGTAQIGRTDGGGLWKADMGPFILRTADQVRAWRSMQGVADGGAGLFILPVRDFRQAPRPIIAGDAINLRVRTSGQHRYIEDETIFDLRVILAHVVGATALRATTIKIKMDRGRVLRGGELFSIKHTTMLWRLYRVTRVLSSDGTGQTLEIRPPLREATADAATVEFDRPCCTVRTPSPQTMQMRTTHGKWAKPSLSVVEAFWPLGV